MPKTMTWTVVDSGEVHAGVAVGPGLAIASMCLVVRRYMSGNINATNKLLRKVSKRGFFRAENDGKWHVEPISGAGN